MRLPAESSASRPLPGLAAVVAYAQGEETALRTVPTASNQGTGRLDIARNRGHRLMTARLIRRTGAQGRRKRCNGRAAQEAFSKSL